MLYLLLTCLEAEKQTNADPSAFAHADILSLLLT
jgi:hypothetical protein